MGVTSISSTLILLFGFGNAFNRILEGSQRIAPHAVEVRAKLGQSFGIGAVHGTSTLTLADDQAGVFEYPEVLGDRWATDREAPGQIHHGLRGVRQRFQNGEASGVSGGFQTALKVSHDLR
jgi:hypothetical protein